jgi:5-(carboxyamino)imidazole ribonucleotide synthase
MRIGILGGGQLGKMLALSGYPLGLAFSFYDPDTTCCARELAPTMHADFCDAAALQQFAKSVDIITYENENIPVDSLQLLEKIKPVFPGSHVIKIMQDRLLEKEWLEAQAILTTPYLPVHSLEELPMVAEKLKFPFIVKTRRHGYDGKGQVVIKSKETFSLISADMLHQGCIAEAWVNYRREFSVIAVRAKSQETQFYDLCENQHQNGILAHTTNKIADSALAKVIPSVTKILDSFNYCGVLAVEFFEDQAGRYLVNEMAPRVHNSGHWTIESAATSQFQNHLRAGLGLPLGDVRSLHLATMENIIGILPNMPAVLATPLSYLHLYGKAERPNRKLGHITRLSDRTPVLVII